MARRKTTLEPFRGRATMNDVAERAGVSQATVSLVMNGAGGVRISAATRGRVLEAAEAVGYRPGRRALSPGALRTVGLLVDDISSSPFGVPLIEGVREVAAQHDCLVSIVATRGQAATEEQALNLLLSQPLAGIVLATIATRRVTPPERLRPLPTVLLNCHDPAGLFPSVVPADTLGGRRATEALIRAGHRRIAYINGDEWLESARDRALGYKQALAAAGLPLDPVLVRTGHWQRREAYAETAALLALSDPPTAIFCANDRMALGCYQAAHQLGLRIPDDVSVVGYDNEWLASHLDPPLTTVLLPHEAMGRWAAENLLAAPADAARPNSRVELECPLVERASVAPPAAARAPRSRPRRPRPDDRPSSGSPTEAQTPQPAPRCAEPAEHETRRPAPRARPRVRVAK